MNKIKNELTAITEKYKKDVYDKFDRSNEPDSVGRNRELILESRAAHHEEIIKYPSKYSTDLDINEKHEIEEFIRTCMVDFDRFLNTVS